MEDPAKSELAAIKTLESDPNNPRAWYNLGSEGGGTVAGKGYSPKQCFEMAVTYAPKHAVAWINLGHAGGGTVAGKAYSPKQCYEMALELDPKYTVAWCNLGTVGGGTVAGKAYSHKQCYELALGLDPKHALTWCNLGVVGGGTVEGQTYSAKQCYEMALNHDAKHAVAWYNLGNAGGGTVEGHDYSAKQCYEMSLEVNPKYGNAWYNLGVLGGGTVMGKAYSQEECYEQALQVDPHDADAKAALSSFMGKATAKADAVMASLLEEEAAEETKKATKKKKTKPKVKQKAPTPSAVPAEELPKRVPEVDPSRHQCAATAQAAIAKKPANEEADKALLAALGRDDDLDAIVAAINADADDATPERLNEARAMRDSIRKQRKKALRRQEKMAAERQAHAEVLLQVLAKEDGISELQAAIVEAQGLAGVAASLDEEVEVAQERLLHLRAAAKTSAIEEQQDLLEEQAVACALRGFDIAPEPDRKPSAEEASELALRELTSRIEELERQKEAAVAEEEYLTAADIKRSIAELVQEREALERAVEEEASKKVAEENESLNECVVCIDAPSTVAVVPCGHKCLCEACSERIQVGDPCPVCRCTVSMTMTVFGR